MQHETLVSHSVGVPLSPSDRTMAVAWGHARRGSGTKLLVATDHEAFPEVIEITPPGTVEPTWCIWRAKSGRLVVDNWQTWSDRRQFDRLAEALRFIAGAITSA